MGFELKFSGINWVNWWIVKDFISQESWTLQPCLLDTVSGKGNVTMPFVEMLCFA